MSKLLLLCFILYTLYRDYCGMVQIAECKFVDDCLWEEKTGRPRGKRQPTKMPTDTQIWLIISSTSLFSKFPRIKLLFGTSRSSVKIGSLHFSLRGTSKYLHFCLTTLAFRSSNLDQVRVHISRIEWRVLPSTVLKSPSLILARNLTGNFLQFTRDL